MEWNFRWRAKNMDGWIFCECVKNPTWVSLLDFLQTPWMGKVEIFDRGGRSGIASMKRGGRSGQGWYLRRVFALIFLVGHRRGRAHPPRQTVPVRAGGGYTRVAREGCRHPRETTSTIFFGWCIIYVRCVPFPRRRCGDGGGDSCAHVQRRRVLARRRSVVCGRACVVVPHGHSV